MSEKRLPAGRAWLIAAALLCLLGVVIALLTWERRASLDDRPLGDVEDIALLSERDDVNVLFILIDTLRAHRLASYGYTRTTSPTLDYLAGTGVYFARNLAQSSWTKASMASLWTGLYPVRTGVLRFAHALPEEAVLPAEIFRDANFRTAGIWRNGWVAPNFGFAQGFESYHRPIAHALPAGFRREKPHVSLEGSDYEVVDAAAEFLRVQGEKRWFLYVHLMDVHQYLYDDETAVFGSDYADIYDNSILHEDGIVLELLGTLSAHDMLDRTVVVVGSDHGEAFRERGIEGHARHVYRESTEVPLILSLPFRLERGIAVRTPTRNIDLWPTVLDLLGLPGLPEPDGRSLLPEILALGRGEASPAASEPGIAHLDRSWGRMEQPSKPAVAITNGRHRFVAELDPHTGLRGELFALASDRAELLDLAAEQPEIAADLRDQVETYLALPHHWQSEAPIVEVDQMERNQLRALGYALPGGPGAP